MSVSSLLQSVVEVCRSSELLHHIPELFSGQSYFLRSYFLESTPEAQKEKTQGSGAWVGSSIYRSWIFFELDQDAEAGGAAGLQWPKK